MVGWVRRFAVVGLQSSHLCPPPPLHFAHAGAVFPPTHPFWGPLPLPFAPPCQLLPQAQGLDLLCRVERAARGALLSAAYRAGAAGAAFLPAPGRRSGAPVAAEAGPSAAQAAARLDRLKRALGLDGQRPART